MNPTHRARAPRRRALAGVCLPLAMALATLAWSPPAALAQETRPKAPTPSKTGEPPRVRNMILLVVLLGLGLGVQAIPSKRGHQD